MNPILAHIDGAVRRLSPYQPGKPIAEVMRERGISGVIKLASNENPLGAGAAAVAAVRALDGQGLARYPDSGGGALRQKLAAQLGVTADNILLGNGSNEILELTAHLLLAPGCASVYSRHAFIVYALATLSRRAQAHVVAAAADYGHDLTAMAAAAAQPGVRIVFIANPNNPTGTWHSAAALRACLRQIPSDVLVVLDEAYHEYLPDPDGASLSLLADFSNLLITRTFSKIHGLAGLRIGYGIAAAELIEILNRIRQPFNVSAAAQAAACAALSDETHVRNSRAENCAGLKTLAAGFSALDISYLPTYANFLTFCPPNAATVYEASLNAGVIIRRLDEYEMPAWLRVNTGLAAENEKFLRILQAAV